MASLDACICIYTFIGWSNVHSVFPFAENIPTIVTYIYRIDKIQIALIMQQAAYMPVQDDILPFHHHHNWPCGRLWHQYKFD